MLPNINLLYLFGSVLVLLDLSYMSRFWTSFEAFLAMRMITKAGLATAGEGQERLTVVCLHNATEASREFLFAMWAHKNAEEAYEATRLGHRSRVVQRAARRASHPPLLPPLLAYTTQLRDPRASGRLRHESERQGLAAAEAAQAERLLEGDVPEVGAVCLKRTRVGEGRELRDWCGDGGEGWAALRLSARRATD